MQMIEQIPTYVTGTEDEGPLHLLAGAMSKGSTPS